MYLWWDAAAAQHNRRCTAMDLSKVVSALAKCVELEGENVLVCLLPSAFATALHESTFGEP